MAMFFAACILNERQNCMFFSSDVKPGDAGARYFLASRLMFFLQGVEYPVNPFFNGAGYAPFYTENIDGLGNY